MAFPTALCASWRCALRRLRRGASFGRQRGVLLGAQLALSQRQREWAEKAMEGRCIQRMKHMETMGILMIFMGSSWDFIGTLLGFPQVFQ
jgi:hypothetical protein